MLGMPDGSYGEHVILRPAPASHAGTYFAIRTADDADALLPAVREVVHGIDAHQPIYTLASARTAILDELGKQRFFLIVVAALAAIALSLTAVGIYGLLSFVVQRRSREIGIRIALGAHARGVLGDILRGGMTLVAAGLVLGIAGALLAGRFMRSIIFGIEPADPATLIGVTAVMAIVAVVACLVPAGRAARVDPITVLKAE
jgi:putative ABC transport system permease protein